MTPTVWVSLAAAFFLSILFNAALIKWARHHNLFMPPIRPRDVHSQPTPRVGGIALLGTFLIVVGLVLAFSPHALEFSGRQIWGIDRNLVGFLLAVILLGVIDIYDDWRGMSWQLKLLAQLAAGFIITAFGILIPALSNPFGDKIVLGQLSGLIVVIWLVAVGNVVNWLDSIDGVAGGVSAITLLVLFFLSISQTVAQPANAILAIIGFASTLGFLIFNLRGKVFLGDSGTVFLGYLIGVLAVISGGKVATVFLVLAIPFLDALVVFVSRILAHQSPFLPDNRHLIHRLLDRGYSKRTIILIFYAISLIFGLVALNTQTLGKLWAVVSAMVVMALFVLLYSSRKPKASTIETSNGK